MIKPPIHEVDVIIHEQELITLFEVTMYKPSLYAFARITHRCGYTGMHSVTSIESIGVHAQSAELPLQFKQVHY